MDLGLRGVHVLVTGASGGIGLETARVFLDNGARVTAHYNTNSASLTSLSSQYDSTLLRIAQADLTNESAVATLFASVASSHPNNANAPAFGPVQVAIINHGIWPTTHQPVHQMSLGHELDIVVFGGAGDAEGAGCAGRRG
ncbi:hypothetical protein HGRIS_001335 [Hohenbuehelia grisea]|uniref:Uncharacterized protein n=1 Tax=Hohenbuehelia grisea TaxID=104357 RepID=A0ABR3JQK3_9AGAR